MPCEIRPDEKAIARAVSNALDEIKGLRDDVIEIHSATSTLMSIVQRAERSLQRLRKLGKSLVCLSALGLLLCQTCMMLRRP